MIRLNGAPPWAGLRASTLVSAILFLIFCLAPAGRVAAVENEGMPGNTTAVSDGMKAPSDTPAGPSGTSASSDDFGNVTEEQADVAEGPRIADPVEPWNRAMYHLNDKFYFWLLKPAAQGYKRVVPEDFRGLFSNFYRNIKAPVRILNNLFQLRPVDAGRELTRFVVNSTVGVAGLRDCAKECFHIEGREADFGQTLGKYGLGFGFYIVWPIIGPSSARDTVGWAADRYASPATYVDSDTFSLEKAGLFTHEAVNGASFRIGDYETLKEAAIDPYVAMRDAYRQYRLKMLEK
jgi:phospholipid-binding lipoprotein MlaA